MRSALLGIALVSACAFDDEPRVVSADEPLPADLVAGDIVQQGDLEVTVPELGEHVVLTVERVDGSSIELAIRHGVDGVVEVMAPAGSEPQTIEAGATGACDDGAFNLSGHTWRETYAWRFHSGSTPAANSKANVETALVRAAHSITTSRNNCGFADQVSATHDYRGRTSTAPNIRGTSTNVTCGNADGVNVVGFGGLPKGVLAVACSWTTGGTAVEGDITYNTRHAWYAVDVPAGCSSKYGVAAVGAHEFGHVFGLGHVSESAHPNLTMSTAARPCSNTPVTLGRGDVRGLRALY